MSTNPRSVRLSKETEKRVAAFLAATPLFSWPMLLQFAVDDLMRSLDNGAQIVIGKDNGAVLVRGPEQGAPTATPEVTKSMVSIPHLHGTKGAGAERRAKAS